MHSHHTIAQGPARMQMVTMREDGTSHKRRVNDPSIERLISLPDLFASRLIHVVGAVVLVLVFVVARFRCVASSFFRFVIDHIGSDDAATTRL